MTEIVAQISRHINDLINLGKILSIDSNIEEMENKALAWMKKNQSSYWRGADMQVVKCSPGANYKDFEDQLIRYNYSVETPCPSRFPVLMTGLVNRVQKKFDYIDGFNKYEFYETIAKSAQDLELNNTDLDKQTICREIVFKQLRLLSSWRNAVIDKENTPSLLDKGWKIYFGYGRNANQDAMLSNDRCPNANYLGPANLENYKFIIDAAGFASVEKEPGSIVYGMLWAVSPEDFTRLDKREGVRIGNYRKDTLKVTHLLQPFDDKIEAVAYISYRPERNVPEVGYIEEIIDGMISGGVSKEQISYLYEFLNLNNDDLQVTLPEIVHSKEKPFLPEGNDPKVGYIKEIIDGMISGGVSREQISYLYEFWNLNKDALQAILSEIFSSEEKPFLPKDFKLPFFAYGLFKSDQIAHERINPYIEEIEPKTMEGCFLAERDGIPLLGSSEMIKDAPLNFKIMETGVYGEIIRFKSEEAEKAYKAISDLEPSNIYKWSTIGLNGSKINVLVGKRIFKGSQSLQHDSWDMKIDDPFIAGLEAMLDRLLGDEERSHEVVELQAAYIMLWSGIERLIALKNSMKKRKDKDILSYLENDTEIQFLFNSIDERPLSFRSIYSTANPKDKIVFAPKNTRKCLIYLRAIRHNVVHRGKGGLADSGLARTAIDFSRQIFQKLYRF